MSYLLDKSRKRNRFLKIIFGIFFFIILFYFRAGIFNGLSYISGGVFRPVLISSNGIGGKINDLGSYFSSKNSLYKENLDLKSKLDGSAADRANYDSVVAENQSLKEILGRKNIQANMILGAILAKPNQSLYDTLLIDVGSEQGIKMADRVFAYGNIPIGYIAEVNSKSSKVILLSNSGEVTQVVASITHNPADEANKPIQSDTVTVDQITPSPSVVPTPVAQGKNVSLEIIGRGGGNFEMAIPNGLNLFKGDQVVLPGMSSYVVGIVETIISDPRNSFQKALLVSPVNIQGLKFVEVQN
ncbi:MAG: hypothetical protein KGL67_01445 [Patescibacteria group bacterium]|nr:hypothetical protein [Patescibacteria group bacterium]